MSTTGTAAAAAAAAPCLRHASYLLLSLATLAKDEGRIVVGNLHSVDTVVIGLPVPGLGLHHSKLPCASRRQILYTLPPTPENTLLGVGGV